MSAPDDLNMAASMKITTENAQETIKTMLCMSAWCNFIVDLHIKSQIASDSVAVYINMDSRTPPVLLVLKAKNVPSVVIPLLPTFSSSDSF